MSDIQSAKPHAKGSACVRPFSRRRRTCSKYTMGGISFQPGGDSDVVMRFSTVAAEPRQPCDTWPPTLRGLFGPRCTPTKAIFDMVGKTTTPIFLLCRDPIKFQQFNPEARNAAPDTNMRDHGHAVGNFWTLSPGKSAP